MDGKNALMFDAQQPSHFSDQLYRLCSSEELRHQLGEAAFATIENQKLYWSHNAEKIVQLFDQQLTGATLDKKLFPNSIESESSRVKK